MTPDANASPRKIVAPFTSAQLVDVLMTFVDVFNEPAGIFVYGYQRTFIRRIIESVLEHDGDVITGLWSRQCLAKGTPVLMFDGTGKNAEDVEVGDVLMGDDSGPRRVLSLGRGRQEMVRVVPNNGYHEPYTVNRSHVLTVKKLEGGSSAHRPRRKVWNTQDVQASDLLGKSLEPFRGFKVAVDFPEQAVPVEPYFLGVWLGDGTSRSTGVTSVDSEVIEYLHGYAERLGLRVSVYENTVSSASSYAIVAEQHAGPGSNPLWTAMRELDLPVNKHIPQAYKSNSRDVRLAVLAGIIDSDGHRSLCSGKENTCEVTFVSRRLAEDTQWLARSLGLRAGLTEKEVNGTTYHRIGIYGDLSSVPTRIARKRWPKNPILREEPTHYGFTLEELPEDDFYGFTVDGNRRFLLGDCTVTHNSGKSEALACLATCLCIMLPVLARSFPDDPRLIQYREGFFIGIFAPKDKQAHIIYDRIRGRAERESSNEIYNDPDIQLSVKLSRGDMVAWTNGSFVVAQTASEQSSVEGFTFHLIIIDEAQIVSKVKISKEIAPMLAATNGTMVKIGTANALRGGFRESILWNLELERLTSDRDWWRTEDGHDRAKNAPSQKGRSVRNHFEYPYDMVISQKRAAFYVTKNEFHLNYEKWVGGELRRLGNNKDNEEFRQNFRLLWQESDLLAIDPEAFADAADHGMEFVYTCFNKRIVAGLDYARKRDSTILTIAEVEDEPLTDDRAFVRPGEDVPIYRRKRVLCWYEIQGRKWHDILKHAAEILAMYSVVCVVCDATGVGDPLTEQLQELLPGTRIVPFMMSHVGNDRVFKHYIQEVEAGRWTYPAGPLAQNTQVFRQYVHQHGQLIKERVGIYIRCYAPEGEHDDYADSAALCCYAASLPFDEVAEEGDNPFFGSRIPNQGEMQYTTRSDRYRR